MTVTALLVSHDGARWLPAVLDGLEAQTRRPDRVIAVDTGSSDTGVDLLHRRLGSDAVIPAGSGSGFGRAVRQGLTAVDTDWVWLLHDDSAPDPRALQRLLEAAADHPGVSVLGPKLREWPSLRRLLEVGVTISGTGRRETGLERGEYDQGQHDQVREVLAVNTAGMLVRRELLERLGFDDRLPLFGDDLDLGWRAARAGHRTLVVPEAVVFHAEAAHRGLRRTRLTGPSPRRAEREAALYTLLVNGSAAALPFQVVRLFLGSLLRALGLLLVRAPREAYDELAALASTYLRPDRIVAGRAARRRTSTVPAKEVRHLLAPPWLPYRHGLDFISDVAAAVVSQAGDVSARRARRAEAGETGPVPVEAESLPEDTGLLARLVASPTAWAFAVLVVLALVGARGALGTGMLWGGALLPAPDSALTWWRTYLESWHATGVGSSAPAAPYVLPLAFTATFLLGKAWLLVDLLFLLVVPLAAFGGYRFLLLLTRDRLPSLWGGVAYGLVPVLSGAVNQGRLGTVVAAIVLPWLARSALFLHAPDSVDRRWRAAWRTALWLALLAAFVPLAWPIAVVLALLDVLVRRRAGADRAAWAPPLLAVGVVPVLLLPWTLLAPGTSGVGAWLREAGLPAEDLLSSLSAWDVLLGRAAEAGAAPAWLSAGVAVAAVAALARRDTRPSVLVAWVVAVVALVTVAMLHGRAVDVPGTDGSAPLWLGFPVLLAQAAGIGAAALAGAGIRRQISVSSFGWRQPLGLAVVALAVLTPLAGLVWWAGTGLPGPLDRQGVDRVPTYMSTAADADDRVGVLLVRGSRAEGLDYLLLRGDGLRTGDDALVPEAEAADEVTGLVGNLAVGPEASDVERLSGFGVEFVYLPPPADPVLAGNLDSVSGLTSASAIRPGSRAWQVEADPTGEALPHDPSVLHPWLLAVQAVALVVAAVFAAPTRRGRR